MQQAIFLSGFARWKPKTGQQNRAIATLRKQKTMNNEPIANQQPTDRQRAIVEAGRLINALTEGNGDVMKDAWYQLSKYTRAALAEIRQAEAQGQLHHTSPNEYLGVG